jgi:hypothetical protein
VPWRALSGDTWKGMDVSLLEAVLRGGLGPRHPALVTWHGKFLKLVVFYPLCYIIVVVIVVYI